MLFLRLLVIFFLEIICLNSIFLNPIFAQNKSLVFLQRFQFKTNDSKLCPFYLQNTQMADSVANILDKFLQTTYQTQTLSRKRINLVDCMEFLGENENMRTIQNTNFDYSVSLESKLESKKINNPKNLADWKLFCTIEIEIFDKEYKRIGKFKAKHEALLSVLKGVEMFPPMILSENDFKALYFFALSKALKQQIDNTKDFVFKAKPPQYLLDFLENATKHKLTWIDRLAMRIDVDSTQNIGLDVDNFKENDTIIARTARIKNPFDKKNYQFQAFTHPRKLSLVQLDIYAGKNHIGSLQNNAIHNENLTKGKMGNEAITWENFGHYKMGFYKKKLMVYAILQQTKTIEKENLGEYVLYIAQNMSNNQKSMWINVLLGEQLMRFVEKYAKK